MALHESPAPQKAIHGSQTPPVALHGSPTSQVDHHRSPTSQVAHHRSPTSPVVHHRSPTSQVAIHNSLTSQVAHHRSPTSQVALHNSPTSQVAHHNSPTSQVAHHSKTEYKKIRFEKISICKFNKVMDHVGVVDEIFMELRWNGFYQMTRFVIFLMSLVSFALHSMSVVFIGKSVDHRCLKIDNSNLTIDDITFNFKKYINNDLYNISYGQCHVEISNGSDVIFKSTCLIGYEYASISQSSFVTEWDLVCEREYFSDVSQTVFVMGQMFGCLFFTRFADTYGRKISYTVTCVLCFVTSLFSSFSNSFVLFLIIRFASAAFLSSSFQLAKIQMIEMMPTTHRDLPEKICSFVWDISLIILCLIAYVTRSLKWNYTQLILSAILGYAVFLWWMTDESMRWLCAGKHYIQMEELILKIAKVNNVNSQKAIDLFKAKLCCKKEENIVYLSNSNAEIPELKKIVGNHPDIHLSVILRNKYVLHTLLVSNCIWEEQRQVGAAKRTTESADDTSAYEFRPL
ncbi:hypothetical protein Btru_059717 [Bulinus truncatus]|nr:hypothetical protein Btru_059717 [Bulinus truncatus]